jgi:hypothetical protein
MLRRMRDRDAIGCISRNSPNYITLNVLRINIQIPYTAFVARPVKPVGLYARKGAHRACKGSLGLSVTIPRARLIAPLAGGTRSRFSAYGGAMLSLLRVPF